MKHSTLHVRVRLMLRALAVVARDECFALKGGTAINLFVRDLPRLSVDIDLVYLPLEEREVALREIQEAWHRIARGITKTIPRVRVSPSPSINAPRLLLQHADGLVKIEPNPVLRGTVSEPEDRQTVPAVEKLLEMAVTTSVVSIPDLYGGKIVAALDRQHPRDLFDVKLLLEREGITDTIRSAFVVYLGGHDRPMADLLDPHLKSIEKEFQAEFSEMIRAPVTLAELEDARTQLFSTIRSQLTHNERRFLLSLKQCEPEWGLLPYAHVKKLPALQWKLQNLQDLAQNKTKHKTAVERLRRILEL